MFWNRKSTARECRQAREIKQLRAQLAATQAELDAERRRSEVKEAEINELAAVVVRNRARVQAETAIATRQRAACEGNVSADDPLGQLLNERAH